MNPKYNQPLVSLAKIESVVQIEPALIIIGLVFFGWVIYKVLLKNASDVRHKNLQGKFLNLIAHLSLFITFFALYAILQKAQETGTFSSERMITYLGILTLISGAVVFVKTCAILLLEYLFLGHMKEGVPVLLGNIFTLLLSLGLTGWFANEILGIRLAPILTTSAIFSLVLGLALQDTLGNLFSGVAIQLDKPYEIGDWIEVMQSGQKWVGQVEEITWRATTLVGIFDEHLIIPNRVISQAEIANFSSSGKPIWRSQTFRIPFQHDFFEIQTILKTALLNVPSILKYPEPAVLIPETTESWILVRCSYCIEDYGKQWRIGTDVNAAMIKALRDSGLSIAAQRIQLVDQQLKA